MAEWREDVYKWRCTKREKGKCMAGEIVIESPFEPCVAIVANCDEKGCTTLCTDEPYEP